MAAPNGNTNAAKGRAWSEAVKRAIRAKYGKEWEESLQELAKQLVEAAAAGDFQALKEVGDRIDGKPAQAVAISGDEDNPLRTVQRVELVDLSASGTGSAPPEA